MIRPPGFRGAAFGTARNGDARVDEAARRGIARELGLTSEWAFLTQVHGTDVVEARGPGRIAEADALFTTRSGLPLAVATADCVPVVLEGPAVVAVVHAGWRGAAGGVVLETLSRLAASKLDVARAAIGPSIGPCCYEVGSDVAGRFPGFVSETRWGSPSVDIGGYLASELEAALPAGAVWRSTECTFTSDELHSYRRTRTRDRQVAVGWLPPD